VISLEGHPRQEFLDAVLEVDSDGVRFLNTFAIFSTEQSAYVPDDLAEIKRRIGEELTSGGDRLEVRRKFMWLARQLNQHLKRHYPSEPSIDL
jgi:hypothetical protein